MRIPKLLAALAAVAACAPDPGFVPVKGVREATAADVTACAYVANFSMKPSVYGPLAEQGLKYSRNRVLADARDAGANTVVFDPAPPGGLYTVTATAYRCG